MAPRNGMLLSIRNEDPEVEDYGNKWSLGALLRCLRAEGQDTTGNRIRISALATTNSSYRHLVPPQSRPNAISSYRKLTPPPSRPTADSS